MRLQKVTIGRRRLPLMVGTDLMRAALLLTVPCGGSGCCRCPLMLIIVMGYGTASAINIAVSMSVLPRLVEPQHLQPAHARCDGADAASAPRARLLVGYWSPRSALRSPSS